MFKISCVLFVLGLLLGFSLHNCYLCYAAHRDVSPKVTIVKKNQYNVSSLPYRAAEDLEFNIEPFPIPEYNAEPLPEPVRNVPSASSSSGNDDLEMRLNQAVHESEASYRAEDESSEYNSYTINDLPSNVQARIPAFVYGSHVFSSNNRDRFISLNGKNYHEGEIALGVLNVVKIQPNYTIFRIDGTSFTVPSLSDWKSK